MSAHEWCRDVPRDEAVRAAEDAAASGRTPPPDHRDLPAAVAELRERVGRIEAFACAGRMNEFHVPPAPESRPAETKQTQMAGRVQSQAEPWKWWNPLPSSCGALHPTPDAQPAPVPAADGLRTERVTLEVTRNPDGEPWSPLEAIPQDVILAEWFGGPGESVRVVDDDDLAKVTAERDAAQAERDAARAEAERLSARVAELEQQIKLDDRWAAAAPAANAGGEKHEPMAWGVLSAGEIVQVSLLQWRDSSVSWSQRSGGTVVPLYAAPPEPRGWLTAEERQAIESARLHLSNSDNLDEATERECKWASVMLRRLLVRAVWQRDGL